MSAISLAATARFMPERVVGNEEFPGLDESHSKMFKGTMERRHVDHELTSTEMLARATELMAAEMKARDGRDLVKEVDAVLTNLAFPDLPFTGSGAMLAKRLGLAPKVVIDAHNGGCIAFILLLDIAQGLVRSHGVERILIGVTQTAAGRIFSHPSLRSKVESAIPGDGAAVALLEAEGPNPVDHLLVKIHPEYAADMTITCDEPRKWWQPGLRQFTIDFEENKLANIIMRGNKLVPAVMKELLAQAGLQPGDVGGLVTNQPNTYFLRNWREAIQLPEERHFHTFEAYANLFQAGIPVNLDTALRAGSIAPDTRLLLAGFSHAGDYSAAALLHWQKA